jgi:hypothetical protein
VEGFRRQRQRRAENRGASANVGGGKWAIFVGGHRWPAGVRRTSAWRRRRRTWRHQWFRIGVEQTAALPLLRYHHGYRLPPGGRRRATLPALPLPSACYLREWAAWPGGIRRYTCTTHPAYILLLPTATHYPLTFTPPSPHYASPFTHCHTPAPSITTLRCRTLLPHGCITVALLPAGRSSPQAGCGNRSVDINSGGDGAWHACKHYIGAAGVPYPPSTPHFYWRR